LKRTIETAELIFPDQKKISLNELDEKDFGLWEGLSADQISGKINSAVSIVRFKLLV
jgi:alpha-ribazole phosphatase